MGTVTSDHHKKGITVFTSESYNPVTVSDLICTRSVSLLSAITHSNHSSKLTALVRSASSNASCDKC